METNRGFRIGAAIGALVLIVAGAAWTLIALVFRPETGLSHYALLAIPALILATSAIRRLVAVVRSPAAPTTEAEELERSREGKRMGIWFGVIFAAEFGVIGAVAPILAGAGRPLLIPVAIVAIVGAHFVPLAKVFRIPTYFVAGVLLVAIAAASLLIPDEPTRLFALGIATTVVLWAAAWTVLAVHVGAGLPRKAA